MSNGKYSDENEQEKGRNNIKGAADLLLKGGTLLSTSCAKCGGVQVRYKEETVCVSCGRKIKEANNGTQQIEVEELQHTKSTFYSKFKFIKCIKKSNPI